MVENFTLVCRLCLSEEGSLEDIFKCDDLNVWILDFLSIVVGIVFVYLLCLFYFVFTHYVGP